MSLVKGFAPLDIASLLAPISAQAPAGLFEEEDDAYQAIDQEMVKLGGLNEQRLDWAWVDDASRQYLANQCKHFRIAGHLMAAQLRTRQWRAWIDAGDLLAGMLEHYWLTGYPKPGPEGLGAKRKTAALLMDRLYEGLTALDSANFGEDYQQDAHRAFKQLQLAAAAAQLDATTLSRIEARLRSKVEASRRPETPSSSTSPSPGKTGGAAVSEEFFVPPSNLKLGDERENRRSLLAVAEFITQQDAYDPTGYQLRRFALWAHLNAAPLARREQRTELMGVPSDIAQGYQDALRHNNVNPVLLLRVERSVASSPYWIRGSYLAASIAARLEMKEVAAAIRLSSERFVRRVPMLTELCFADGRPFVDAETMGWLSGAADGTTQSSHVQEYGNLRDELVAQLDNEGVEVVLRRLQDLQTAASSARQRSYATVIAADLLASRGLTWLANDLYASVSRAMQCTTAEQWEPALYEHIERQQPAQMLIGQAR
ncbi:type VI secretion system protein TssA [Dyella kyungheensis]|uniref:Type VI secretion system protein TssA n=1 Tax=Dyella kyungheensis TaxID=1242174 RepID=A0ABS2JXT2_9GAMM|nr:type VI secretion system protein TssA [Dyella kyungheensis]MBM7123328.1 type VI secretion system protein TssA [Dyella kyungheensis]